MQRNPNAARFVTALPGLAALILLSILGSGFLELHRAEQARAANEHVKAFESYHRAAQRLPWRSDLWEQAGSQALEAGLAQDAIDMLQRPPRLSLAGWVLLGDAYRQNGQMELALSAYQSAMQLGASPDVYRGMAALFRLKGDLPAERNALQNQLLLDSGDAAAQYRLGLLLCLSDIKSAMTHFQVAAQLDDEYEPVSRSLSSALTLAELSPSETDRSVMLGRALGLVGEWDLARLAFQQAVDADGTNALAWAWLGEAKQHQGEDAALEMEKALALDAGSPVVRGLRGLYWKRLGDQRKALQEYQSASDLDPKNPAWSASLAETYARLGDLVSALAYYQQATQLAPEDSQYWRLLATFCLEYNVHIEDTGLPAAQRAWELSPQDALAVDILGWSQLAAGKPQAAVETLLKAVEIAPDYAAAHYHLALACLQTGRRSEAYDHLQLAIQLDPNGSAGSQASQVLEQQFP